MGEHKLIVEKAELAKTYDWMEDTEGVEELIVCGEWVKIEHAYSDVAPEYSVEVWIPDENRGMDSYLPPALIEPSSIYGDYATLRDDVTKVFEEPCIGGKRRAFTLYHYEDEKYRYVIHEVDEYDGHGYPVEGITRHEKKAGRE